VWRYRSWQKVSLAQGTQTMKNSLLRITLFAWLTATAACAASPASTDTAGLNGPAPTGIVVSLAPLTAQVPPGGSTSFTASVTGSTDTGATWSVQEGAAGGSVTASGVYNAPAAEGTYHVVAASKADATILQVATVTVKSSVSAPPAGTVAVVLGPSSSAVDACQTVAFSATVSGTANPGITWSVREGPSGGSITPAGVYTAPSSPGTYHVVATSAADPTRTAEGSVAVAAERVLAVAVTPGSGTVAANGALAFAAMVTTSCGTFAAQ
jgi:hypothetical protein